MLEDHIKKGEASLGLLAGGETLKKEHIKISQTMLPVSSILTVSPFRAYR